mmetsp:Transcript_27292/g.37482  ORF Transcript_27292/g.37482 Transcript_27292/m.37482 type:complete len:512 (+) Transcript_27292:333-1868(+)
MKTDLSSPYEKILSALGTQKAALDTQITAALDTQIAAALETQTAALCTQITALRTQITALGAQITAALGTQTAAIKDALGFNKVIKKGSTVNSDDYKKVFKFFKGVFDTRFESPMLCWSQKQLRKFKVEAKPILYSYCKKIVELANDRNTAEIKHVQPVLRSLLLDLLPVAFPNSNISELEVGRFEYYDAAIQNYDGKTIVYNGTTGLSIIFKPMNLCIGGLESMVSIESIVKENDSERMNDIGVNAVAQTGTQILGAANRLKAVNAIVDNVSMLVTNGWQWMFVKRGLTRSGEHMYYHFDPISLGEVLSPKPVGKQCADEDEDNHVNSEKYTATTDSSRRKQDTDFELDYNKDASAEVNGSGETYPKKTITHHDIIVKPLEDICFDEVCHLMAMMFDNTEFLWQQLKAGSLFSSMTMLSIKENDDENDGDRDDDVDEGSDHNDENRGVRGPTNTTNTKSGIGKVSGSGKGKGNWSSGRKKAALQTRNMNVNVIPGAELTEANLMRFNLGY